LMLARLTCQESGGYHPSPGFHYGLANGIPIVTGVDFLVLVQFIDEVVAAVGLALSL
jgi:hypothetical protein